MPNSAMGPDSIPNRAVSNPIRSIATRIKPLVEPKRNPKRSLINCTFNTSEKETVLSLKIIYLLALLIYVSILFHKIQKFAHDINHVCFSKNPLRFLTQVLDMWLDYCKAIPATG